MNPWVKKIQRGESRKVEFKETLPKGTQIAKTSVAFANGAGGDIFLGVDNKHQIIGLTDEQLSDYPDQLSGMIFDAIRPALIPEIFTINIDTKTLLVVRIHPSHSKPYFIQSLGEIKGTYIRVGTINKKADRAMLIELARQSKNLSFDEEIAYDQSFSDVNTETFFTEYINYTQKHLKPPQLKNLKLIKPVYGTSHATQGLQLLCGDNTAFPYARIQCALFKGITPLEFIDRKELSGTLVSQIESAISFLKQHIPLAGKIEGIQRIDRYEISMIALREAVINAVVHRDYSISGSDIKIAIFDDRLEITSPGTLPNSLNIDEIGTGRSEIRNRAIAATFKKMGIIEQWGTGTAKILSECSDPTPTYKETGGFVKVTFIRKKNLTLANDKKTAPKTALKTAPKTAPKIKTRDEIIILLKKNPELTKLELMSQLNKASGTIKEHIRILQRDGRLQRIGSRKTGHWKVLNE